MLRLRLQARLLGLAAEVWLASPKARARRCQQYCTGDTRVHLPREHRIAYFVRDYRLGYRALFGSAATCIRV